MPFRAWWKWEVHKTISKEIWEFALSMETMITAEYLPGRLNVRADWASRNFQDPSEWLLFPRVFQDICVKWGFSELDLFVSRVCHQIPSYLSWKADPHSLATGASGAKLITEEVDAILITPSWPAQPWYSQVKELSVTEPPLLPQLNKILVSPQDQVHPLVVSKTLRLAAFTVSGRVWPQKEFRQGLQSL